MSQKVCKHFDLQAGNKGEATNPLGKGPKRTVEDLVGFIQVKNTETIILGSGIAGLLSAWALSRLGEPFVIIDKGPREALPRIVPGCVYLHEACGLSESALKMAYLWTGIMPLYAKALLPGDLYHLKVWGNRPRVPNSVDKIPVGGYHSTIFSANHALVWLYKRFHDRIVIRNLELADIELLMLDKHRVISTIPIGVYEPDAPRISKETWIVQVPESPRRPEDGLPSVLPKTASVVYNLDITSTWYRASSMFGFTAIEFIADPGGNAAKFRKIISGPDAKQIEARYNGRLILTGRWGRWERGFLSHHAYHQVLQAFGR